MLSVIRELDRHGQSVWLDGLERDLLRRGRLRQYVEEGVRGLTTNPAILERAIAETSDYDEDIAGLGAHVIPAREIYERLAVQDLRAAADLLRPVWEETDGRDGYVSLEVSPELAHDARATVDEARRLWVALARPNVMIKVPATAEGIDAIAPLAGAGLNLNVTLLFSRAAYRAAAEAWMAGIEERVLRGEDVSRAASVASFFVSRVDGVVDRRLDELAAKARSPAAREEILSLRGLAAIANARLAYREFRALLDGSRFQRLRMAGVRPQRVLWASTSVKDPYHSVLAYVEALVGPDTVDTMPLETYRALRHGARITASVLDDVENAEAEVAALGRLGISIDEVTDGLLANGVRKFVEPFQRLLTTIEARSAGLDAAADA